MTINSADRTGNALRAPIGDDHSHDHSNPVLRPHTGKGNETATNILEQTINLLSTSGLAAVSIRSVAEKCNISPGNVTYYFKTKEVLFESLAAYMFERWTRRFYAKMPDFITSPDETFTYSIEFMIEENKRPKTSTMLQEMWALSNHSPAVLAMMDVFYSQMRAWIETLLRAMNPLQPLPTRHLRAALITAQIEGLMILIGRNRVPHPELIGLEREAVIQIKHLATANSSV
ncbi:MAG: TetR/AcrR family transcriptional regulator [Acidocella sp.]|nr:TetR/AcrR family transcriptional regulator [Acidocella sp.]